MFCIILSMLGWIPTWKQVLFPETKTTYIVSCWGVLGILLELYESWWLLMKCNDTMEYDGKSKERLGISWLFLIYLEHSWYIYIYLDIIWYLFTSFYIWLNHVKSSEIQLLSTSICIILHLSIWFFLMYLWEHLTSLNQYWKSLWCHVMPTLCWSRRSRSFHLRLCTWEAVCHASFGGLDMF